MVTLKWGVLSSYDKTIYLWNRTGEVISMRSCCSEDEVRRFAMLNESSVLIACRGHEEEVIFLCFVSDYEFVSGSKDGTIRIWNMDGTQVALFRNPDSWICCLCVMQDGRVVSGDYNGMIRIWNRDGSIAIAWHTREKAVLSFCCALNDTIVLGSHDGTIGIWKSDGTKIGTCPGHDKSITSICVTPNDMVISSSMSTIICLWDVSMLRKFSYLYEKQVRAIAELLETPRLDEKSKQECWQQIEKIINEENHE